MESLRSVRAAAFVRPFRARRFLINFKPTVARASVLTLGYLISRLQREDYDENPRFFIKASTFGSLPRKLR